jgi:hypothetical protein
MFREANRRRPRLFDSLVDWPGHPCKNSVAREFLPAVPILAVPQNSVKKLRLLHRSRFRRHTGGSDYVVYVGAGQLLGWLPTAC